jgi:hypothetical protein
MRIPWRPPFGSSPRRWELPHLPLITRISANSASPPARSSPYTPPEQDFRPERIVSNTFPLEWPKGSGRIQQYPEIDDARWFPEPEARLNLVKGQLPILDALVEHVRA